MAIFKCAFFYFRIPEGICLAGFTYLQEYENKTSYTPEDGHVGRNM
jgi:hypothetical protein